VYDQGVTSLQCQVLFRIRFALEYAFEVDRNDPEAALVALAEQCDLRLLPGVGHAARGSDGTKYRRRFGQHDDARTYDVAYHPNLGALCSQQLHADYGLLNVLTEFRGELGGELIDGKASDRNVAYKRMIEAPGRRDLQVLL